MDEVQAPKVNRSILQEVIAGLGDGVILVDPDGSIAWANTAALTMHRIETLDELGSDAKGYRRNFTLRYRNNHPLEEGQYPIERLLSGETVDDVTVEISPSSDLDLVWVHTVRSLAIADGGDKPDVLVLVMRDETPRFEAEERFERAFNANPAPGLICRLDDHRFIRVNQGFLEMTGFTKEDVVGKSVEALGLCKYLDRWTEVFQSFCTDVLERDLFVEAFHEKSDRYLIGDHCNKLFSGLSRKYWSCDH